MESASALTEKEFELIVKSMKELAKATQCHAKADGLSSESTAVTINKPNPQAWLVNVPVGNCKLLFTVLFII